MVGVEPGGGLSVVQDDLDKTGHVCLFGVMQGEKRVFLEQKRWKMSQNFTNKSQLWGFKKKKKKKEKPTDH